VEEVEEMEEVDWHDRGGGGGVRSEKEE